MRRLGWIVAVTKSGLLNGLAVVVAEGGYVCVVLYEL